MTMKKYEYAFFRVDDEDVKPSVMRPAVVESTSVLQKSAKRRKVFYKFHALFDHVMMRWHFRISSIPQ